MIKLTRQGDDGRNKNISPERMTEAQIAVVHDALASKLTAVPINGKYYDIHYESEDKDADWTGDEEDISRAREEDV